MINKIENCEDVDMPENVCASDEDIKHSELDLTTSGPEEQITPALATKENDMLMKPKQQRSKE